MAEAERERPLRLSADPFTGPLFRTLMRLRHDLVIMGRAARYPIPASLKASLHAPLNTVGEEIGRHLQACSSALKSKSGAPDSAKLDAALTLYASELEALRRAGKLRRLPMEALEQLLATSFALDQTRFDLRDLNRCVDEWAETLADGRGPRPCRKRLLRGERRGGLSAAEAGQHAGKHAVLQQQCMPQRGQNMRRNQENKAVRQQLMRAFEGLVVLLLRGGRQFGEERDQRKGLPKKSDGLSEVEISAQPVSGSAMASA